MKKIGCEFHNLKSNTTNMVQKLKAHIRKNFEMQLPEGEKNLRQSATENYFQRYNDQIANQIVRKE